jgi:hypothetical protein
VSKIRYHQVCRVSQAVALGKSGQLSCDAGLLSVEIDLYSVRILISGIGLVS